MTRREHARGVRSFALAATGVALSLSGCFDSDDRWNLGDDVASTTRGPKPNELPPAETGDEGPPPDVGIPDATCADAVNCVADCALELAAGVDDPSEIDLSCFFECEAGLTVDEALKLVRAGACVFSYCTDNGFCEATPEDPLAILGFGTCDRSMSSCEMGGTCLLDPMASCTQDSNCPGRCEGAATEQCFQNSQCPGSCMICLLNGVTGGDANINDQCMTELMDCEGTP